MMSRYFRYFTAALLFPVMAVLIFSSICARAESESLQLISLRLSGDADQARIIAVFNKKPDYDIMVLARPARLVINLPAAEFPRQKKRKHPAGILKDVRYGMIGSERSRMVFTMKSAFRLEHAAAAPLQDHIWQMVIEISRSSDREFEKMLRVQQAQKGAKPAVRADLTADQAHDRPFTVVIDAGHGDFDGGAMGVSGVLEKEITLAFAQALRNHLQKKPGIYVYLTREDDVFLRLKERVAIARNYGADLFISIHADHINVRSQRGATVYTLSDKASDAIAGRLAEHENRADLLDGLPPDEPPEVTDILIDLARRETHAFSIHFADQVIDTLKKADIKLIKNPHRYAGFQVLRAADIPSVLIELGYLSNAEDERLISDPQWRDRMAALIAGSIGRYADLFRREAARR